MMSKNSFPIPSISLYLSFGFWELFEAAYILSKWPPCIGVLGVPVSISDRIGRHSIYGWSGSGPLNLKVMGAQFNKVLAGLKRAIDSGWLESITASYAPGQSSGNHSFVRSGEVLMWALLQGLVLPAELSQELNLFQIEKPKLVKNCHQKVANQVIGQFLLEVNRAISVNALSNHGFIKKFGSGKNSQDGERKAIRRALDELFDSKGSPGAPLKGGTKRKQRIYVLRPIPSVLERDANGMVRYCFPLLKTALMTALQVKIELLGQDRLLGMTEKAFLNEFLTDAVVRVYIQDSPANLVRFIMFLIIEQLQKRYFSHHKICLIPLGERGDMTIGQLSKQNRDFCLEHLTAEERQSMKL